VSEQPARQTNGAVAYGKTVWFRHPLLVSSRRRFFGPNRVRKTFNPPMTVTRRIRRRGERGISRKTIAQGRRNAPTVPVCSCAFAMCILARETAGAASTRRSLRPPLFGRNEMQGPGETRRGNAEVCLMSTDGPSPRLSSPAQAGDPVFQRHQRSSREAAAYWIPACAGMTAVGVARFRVRCWRIAPE
jgi:hypothetical protein